MIFGSDDKDDAQRCDRRNNSLNFPDGKSDVGH
jgi:hypothetical protein